MLIKIKQYIRVQKNTKMFFNYTNMWKASISSLVIIVILILGHINSNGRFSAMDQNRFILILVMEVLFLLFTLIWIYDGNQGGKRPNKVE